MRAMAAFVLAGVPLVFVAANDFSSGLEVGREAPGFELTMATGDDAGKSVDSLRTWDNRPVLLIFVGEITRPGFGLLRQLDRYGRLRQPDRLEVLIVRTSANAEQAAQHARLLFETYDVKSPAGVAAADSKALMPYGLNAEAEVTVLLLDKQHKVVHNLARRTADPRDFALVRKEIDKMLGPSPVPFP